MSKAQETKMRIIEQAAALFNQQGYAGSSMSDLMRVTGFSIYNHFRSKDELALEAFDFAVNRVQSIHGCFERKTSCGRAIDCNS